MAKRKTGGMLSTKIELLDRLSNINRDRMTLSLNLDSGSFFLSLQG